MSEIFHCLVFGKSGQLAQELNSLNKQIRVSCLGHHEVDLLNAQCIATLMEELQPDAVINAAAYTAVDQAESDKENAFLLNESAVVNIASHCKHRNINLVHVSTDFVFDGNQATPYRPDDEIRPLNIYGMSKASGEKALLKIMPESSCLIRTSWVYSAYGNNFVKSMLKLIEQKDQLGIVYDQIGSPTWAKGLAKACLYAAQNKIAGLYHYSDVGVASWYDFAVAIQDIAFDKKILSKKIPIKAILTSEYPTAAKRPRYSVMDKSQFEQKFSGVELKHWRSQLGEMLDEIILGGANV